MSLSLPVIGVYQQESVSPEWRVAMSGAVSAATGLSGAVMAYLGAYIITRWGYRELFLVAAILVGAGALLFLIFTRSAKAGRSQKRRGAS